MHERTSWKKELKEAGEQLVKAVCSLVRAGNARRIVVCDPQGRVVYNLTVTLTVIFAVLVPLLVALGVVLALVSGCTIRIEQSDRLAAIPALPIHAESQEIED